MEPESPSYSIKVSKFLSKVAITAIIYFALGQLSFLTAPGGLYASAVWPSAGIAVVAVLFWRWSGLFGVFVGSALGTWLLHAHHAGSDIWQLSLIIGLGSALQAALARFMITSSCGWPNPLQKGRDILIFMVTTGPIACIVSASVGAFTLLHFGHIQAIQFNHTWQIWWIGDVIGVVTLAPMLAIIGQPNIGSARKWIISGSLLFILLGSSSVYNHSQRLEQSRLDNQLKDHSQRIQNDISQQFGLINENLFALRQLYNSAGDISYDQFQRFSQPIFQRLSSLQALEWVPRVTREERPAIEQAMHSLGFSTFTVTRRSHQGSLIDSENLSEYYPVKYISPLRGNENALGFDLNSNAQRSRSLKKALSSGLQTMSAPLQLVQDNDQSPSALILVPVYDGKRLSLPSNYDTIKEQSAGLMVAVVRYHDIINKALKNTLDSHFAINITDIQSSQSIDIFQHNKHLVDHSLNYPFSINQRNWLLTVSPTENYLASQSLWQQNFALLAVLCSASLLGVVILTLSGSHAEVTRTVNQQTQLLEASKRKAERANSAKSQFLSKISHEIRTPLNAIIGFSHRIEKRELHYLSEQGKEALKAVIRNSDHLLTVVNNLLDISKIESGQVTINTSNFNLSTLVNELGEDFRPRATSKKILWRYSTQPDEVFVRSDRQRIEQIIFHLLNNAFDNTQNGAIHLSAELNDNQDCLTLSISDTGAGIEPERLSHLFDFYSDESDVDITPKNGIGLALVKAYIQVIDGDLEVESAIAQGTTIRVQIPISQQY